MLGEYKYERNECRYVATFLRMLRIFRVSTRLGILGILGFRLAKCRIHTYPRTNSRVKFQRNVHRLVGNYPSKERRSNYSNRAILRIQTPQTYRAPTYPCAYFRVSPLAGLEQCFDRTNTKESKSSGGSERRGRRCFVHALRGKSPRKIYFLGDPTERLISRN